LGPLAAALSLLSTSAAAQNTGAQCAGVLRIAVVTDCQDLALFIVDALNSPGLLRLADVASPRDMQSRAGEAPAMGGTVADGEAVSSVKPVALAGGSLAAVGSDGGASTMVAMAINPLNLLGDASDPSSADGRSRGFDATAFFPVAGLDQNDDGEIDYFGLRFRINLFGAGLMGIGPDLAGEAATALAAVVADETAEMDAIETILLSAPNLPECVELLRGASTDVAATAAACGSPAPARVSAARVAAFHERLDRLRADIDAEYWGLDVRFDFGDPTMGEVPGARGRRIFVGGAYGKRSVPSDPSDRSFGVRLSGGVRTVNLEDPSIAEDLDDLWEFEGGAAVEMVYPSAFQPVRIMAGVEARGGGDDPDDALTEQFASGVVTFKGSVSVPISATNAITLSFGRPLKGQGQSSLSVSANWSLLMSDRLGGGS